MNRMSFLLIFCLFAIGCDRLSILSPGELRIENRSDARIESVKVSVNGVVKAEVSGEATSGVIWSPDYPFPGRGSRYRIEIQLSGSANYFIDRTFVYDTTDDLVFVLNGDYSLTSMMDEVSGLTSGMKISLSADQKRKQEEIEAGFQAYKNWLNDRTERMVTVLSAMAKENKVVLTMDNKELKEFSTTQNIIDYFELEVTDGYLGTVFTQVTTEFTGDAETAEFQPALEQIEAETASLLPKAPQNLLLPSLKESAVEDERYITPSGGAPIDKLNEGYREQIYWYSGILEAASGVKGAVPFGTVLWPKDRKNGGKHSVLFRFASEAENRMKIPDGIKDAIRAGLKEIELGTNGALSYREVSELAEIFASPVHVVVRYRKTEGVGWAGRASVGQLGGWYEINADKIYESAFIGAENMLAVENGSFPALKLYRSSGAAFPGKDSVYGFMRTIIHEWGHTAGLMHEHCRYDRDLYVSGVGSLQPQIYHRITKSSYASPAYDIFSIMNYYNWFDLQPDFQELYNGITVGGNTLSEMDKEFLASIYNGRYQSPLSKMVSLHIAAISNSADSEFDGLRHSWNAGELGVRINNGKTAGGFSEIQYYGIDLNATEQGANQIELGMTDDRGREMYFPEEVNSVSLVPVLFYGQTKQLKINGRICDGNSSQISLNAPLTEVSYFVTSQDRSHSTEYIITLKKTDNVPESISLRDRKTNSLIAEKTNFDYSEFNPGLIYTDWVRINVNEKKGQKVLIKKTSETSWREGNSFDVKLTAGKQEEIEVKIGSFGTESQIYRVTLMLPAEAAAPEALTVSYFSGENRKTADLLNSGRIEFYMEDSADSNLKFNYILKTGNPGQRISLETIIDGRRDSYSPEISGGEINYSLPANQRTIIRVSVSCGSLVNVYEYVFFRYQIHSVTLTAEEGSQIKVSGFYDQDSDEDHLITAEREIFSKQTVTLKVKTIREPVLQYKVATGYTVKWHGNVVFRNGKRYVDFVSGSDSSEVTAKVKNAPDFQDEMANADEKGLNHTLLKVKSMGTVGWDSKEGYQLYLKSGQADWQYRVYKEEDAGGAIAAFDVLVNGVVKKEKLGWATYGNGWYPSVSGWYTETLKNGDTFFVRIRQDVAPERTFATLEFKAIYEHSSSTYKN